MECKIIDVMKYDEIEGRSENGILIHLNDLRHNNMILETEMLIMKHEE
jgi:hypothetical protein